MKYNVTGFKEEFIESAVELFLESYKEEKLHCKYLPEKVINHPEIVKDYLLKFKNESGVMVFNEEKKLVGYMLSSYKFSFKNQRSVIVQEYGHASIREDQDLIYKLMYMDISQKWLDNDLFLHIICHFSGNKELINILYETGYGAIINERLRDISTIDDAPQVEIILEDDISKLVDLQCEHMAYYKKAPIFIIKDSDSKSVKEKLKQFKEEKQTFLVYYHQNKASGLFIVGESGKDEEGLLLRNTNSAQIKHAYIKPDLRGKGIGKALLNKAVAWSKEQGYERLFVEHETANFSGGIFWGKYFTSYLNASMRYVDNTLNK